MKALFIVILSLISLGCQFKPAQKPSILVVAVEGLDFDSVPCLPGGIGESTFSNLCTESVRFTHAFTPSTLSQSALASVLTARYPNEHKVKNNGANYLSENFLTLPEVAHKNNYRTAFFSGGAPIFRKSGFAQGFELFEDNIGLAVNRYYRPVSENFRMFTNWLNRIEKNDIFFSMIFLPDLQFPKSITKTDSGSERSLTRKSQIDEIEESLGSLIDRLRDKKRWDNTYFVLVGLNGQSRREVKPNNLYSENSHITLLVKPARVQRDQGIEWSVDVNVNLVDLGATLFNILGYRDITYFESKPSVVSFYSSLERPSISWHKERIILSESDWANWRKLGNARYALRKKQWFMLNDLQPELYNTLVDRYELNPIEPEALGAIETYQNFKSFIQRQELGVWQPPSEEVIQKIEIAKSWFENESLDQSSFQSLVHLIQKRPWDEQLAGWLARYYISSEDWQALRSLGQDYKKPLWVYVAEKRMGLKVPLPAMGCFSLLVDGKSNQQSSNDFNVQCNEKLFSLYIKWYKAKDEDEKSFYAKRFISERFFQKIDLEVSWLNYSNYLMWDTQLSLPSEPTSLELLYLLSGYPKPK